MVDHRKKSEGLGTLDSNKSRTFLPREGGPRSYKAQGLAKLMPKLTRKVAGKRPALVSDLKVNWTRVIGEDLAKFTRPVRLVAGTLHLEMALGAGPVVAMRQSDILSRVQLYLGSSSIKRISLHQAEFPIVKIDALNKQVSNDIHFLRETEGNVGEVNSVDSAMAYLKAKLDKKSKT